MPLPAQDFTFLAGVIKKRSGIFLSDDKQYLVESRLLPLARKYGLKDIGELIVKMRPTGDEKLLNDVTEAMTTNESSFLRDIKPFAQLRGVVIPRILTMCPTKKKLRIWSAACSTGQEPYSIAMSLLEEPKCAGMEIEILATDIASHALEKAKQGLYTQFEVQRGLPITMLMKYFSQSAEGWKIHDKVRNMVKFERLNLSESFASLGSFDVIFCRNVLIYFDTETKMQVLHNISKLMEPHSALSLGCAESIFGIEEKFSLLKDTVGIYSLK